MKWFYNLRTMTKLMVAFLLICAILGAVGWMSVTSLASVNANAENLYEVQLLPSMELATMRGLTHRVRASVYRSLALTTPAEVKAEVENARSIEKQIDEVSERFKPTIVSPFVREEFAKYEAALKVYKAHADERVFKPLLLGQKEAAAAGAKDGAAKFEGVIEAINNTLETKKGIAKQKFEESQAIYASNRVTMFALVGGVLVIALAMGFFIGRIISKPLKQAVDVLQAMAQGDFTKHLAVNTRDEVGLMAKALNQAIEGIRAALHEVRAVADTVASASQQLAASSEEISSGAQEQASSLEETASSLEEITSTVKQNADNAGQARQLAGGARDVADKGGQVVGSAVEAMGEINKSSKRIADIITTIDEIAFQTNLLALNAAVEAARAGEQGRGFAVVAAEVRNLAQRSATSAKEIKGLIQDSVRKVESGSELVNRSGQSLQEIVASVKRVTDIVAEIAAASLEQSTGIEQVNKAVAQMDTVTQANASQTEELSGTAESLTAQAQQLQALVARFKLDGTRTERTTRDKASQASKQTQAPRVENGEAKPAKPDQAKNRLKQAVPADHGASAEAEHLHDLLGVGTNGNTKDGFKEF
jgi:methyl-accepting chemotaxis protein